jgi:hypothetical protein
MGFFAFYAEVLQRSFLEALNLAKTLIFLAIVLVAILGLWWRGILTLHTHLKNGLVTAAVLIGLIIVEVPFVVYTMWKEENTARLSAECKLAAISNETMLHRELVKTKLQDFYVRAQDLFKESVTQETFQDWVERFNAFTKDAFVWVTNTMGPRAAAKLQDMNGFSYSYKPRSVNDAHENGLNWLNKESQNLVTLMDDPNWDSFKPNISSDCH